MGERRKPGRPAKFDRTAAVRSAMELFWKRGYEAVSTSDLADAMAIERSSFYNSFGDRDRVFREATAVYAAAQPDAALADIQPGEPVKPALRKAFRDLCRVRAADAEGRGCLLVNSIAELVGVHPQLGKEITGTARQRVRILERLVDQAAAQGEIDRPADARAAARALFAFLCGLNVASKVIRDEDVLWRISRDFLGRYGF